MKTIEKFGKLLKADDSLSVEYKKLLDSKDEEKIIGFMKTHGVSQEDLETLKNKELSDDELDGVAGGGADLGVARGLVCDGMSGKW